MLSGGGLLLKLCDDIGYCHKRCKLTFRLCCGKMNVVMIMKENEIILYETADHEVKLNVNTDGDTVWLSLDQLTDLFGRDKSTISRHIRNAFKEGELDKDSVVANFAKTAADGKTYQVDYYNLDVIISVGYRVKSQRGVEFRKWENSVLRDYIIKGYAVNNKRIEQIGEVIRIMKRAESQLDAKQVLSVIEKYNCALDIGSNQPQMLITIAQLKNAQPAPTTRAAIMFIPSFTEYSYLLFLFSYLQK